MKRLLRSLFLLTMSMASFALIVAGVAVWFSLRDLPSLDALRDYRPAQSTVVYDRNGALVGRYFEERRTVVPLEKMNKVVPLAFVAAEDGDFYQHQGIDYMGVLRAILIEIKHVTIGGPRAGGSTITQQTARAMLLSSKQTYVRKIKEMVLAKRIEKALTKDQILYLYLNQIYFGNGAYGVEEGALTYFQKPAAKLEIFEAAALASIPKSPNKINPFGDTGRLRERQHYVLDQMVRRGFINEQQAVKAKAVPLFGAISHQENRVPAPYFLQSVKNELLPKLGDEFIRQGGSRVFTTLDGQLQNIAEDSLRSGLREIDKRDGYRGPLFRPTAEQDKQLKTLLDGFRKSALKPGDKSKVWDLSRITTASAKRDIKSAVNNTQIFALSNKLVVGARVTKINDTAQSASLDLGSMTVDLPFRDLGWARSQFVNNKKFEAKKISDVFKTGDIVLVKLQGSSERRSVNIEQEPIINGGFVALDVKTGGVLAMVGGYDFNASPFNRIMQAKRQVGSGIKPFVYGLALDKNIATATTIITDAPKAFFDPGTEEFWRPRNHTGKYLGDITLRRCLTSSINSCTITLLEKIGLFNFLSFAKDLNLNRPETPYPRNLTIALGSAENYPIDVANAMRIFPNQGVLSNYYMINKVVHKNGDVQEFTNDTSRQVFGEEGAFLISNILQGVISPANRARYLDQVRCDLAGKTGTTNDARSVWFLGFSPKIMALVFVGYDDNRSIGENVWGATAAFPIWANFMNRVPDNAEALSFHEPANMQWHYVNSETGIATANYSPEQNLDESGAARIIREAFKAGTAPNLATEGASNQALEVLDNAAFSP